MMSATRLFWSGRRGFAQCDGVRVPLTTRPDIPGLPEMTEMDYLPGMCATVRDNCDARRDLKDYEILATQAWLSARCAAAEDAANNETTIVVVQR
jgi:hypothetical protein